MKRSYNDYRLIFGRARRANGCREKDETGGRSESIIRSDTYAVDLSPAPYLGRSTALHEWVIEGLSKFVRHLRNEMALFSTQKGKQRRNTEPGLFLTSSPDGAVATSMDVTRDVFQSFTDSRVYIRRDPFSTRHTSSDDARRSVFISPYCRRQYSCFRENLRYVFVYGGREGFVKSTNENLSLSRRRRPPLRGTLEMGNSNGYQTINVTNHIDGAPYAGGRGPRASLVSGRSLVSQKSPEIRLARTPPAAGGAVYPSCATSQLISAFAVLQPAYETNIIGRTRRKMKSCVNSKSGELDARKHLLLTHGRLRGGRGRAFVPLTSALAVDGSRSRLVINKLANAYKLF
ncbi:hypothetical protein EVAR_51008_1 [Eumeta japonica]|uniref:Uncharacterized protein n=1 Tax=Eumeta variegata TaxID=151549 RepID=A0A4C1ZY98_EUMVA|nr:hypothetical protein EVAR_51008_1 [Eumeta japonica]